MAKKEKSRIVAEGLTYDDVLLVPSYSSVLPREVSTKTRFSKNIELNIPIVSSAMDTVTESAMAIALAREGGIGVIHKNIPIEAQASEVRKVKRSESGMITDPVTLSPGAKVLDAIRLMREHSIGGVPIVNHLRHLVGIITNRDLRFEKNMTRVVDELMTPLKHLVTAPEGTTLIEAESLFKKHKIEKLPLINRRGELVGLMTYQDITKIKKYPNASKDSRGRLRVAAAVGVGADSLLRAKALVDAGVDALVIDTAHGHSFGVIKSLKDLKKAFGKKVDIVVGNIATAEAATELIKAGADALKVGIGPGSICTTRIIAGVGVPQLHAVMEVANIANKKKIPVIADGGVRYTGDVPKALAGGASSVMIGGMLAGVDEAPGETIIYEGRKFKSYRGMGSLEAMQLGSKDRYFQDMEDDIKKLVPEGISGRVAYKGSLSEVMHQLIGGLRAGMGYCGAPKIEKLWSARFVRITHAGVKESHPHDVSITREAPNYSK